jgi:hypothetical protein
MGTMTGTLDLDRQSLQPIHYEMNGMASVKLDYTATAVTGEMAMAGQTTKIDQKLDAPVLSAGAGLEVALSGMPLAEGYQSTLRTFEASQQKVRLARVSVAGAESVTVPAGTFETFVVDIEPIDGENDGAMKLHVTRQAPHQVVKAEGKLPLRMGGGSVTTELKAMSPAEKVGSR